MRLAKKAMIKEALQKLIDTLALNPTEGALIKDTGGIRKIRWETGKGSSKRAGLRVLYYFDGKQLVFLLTMFKKSDHENIDPGEKAELRKLIKEILE